MGNMKLERQKKYAGVNLYIKNLADNIDDDRLRQEFSKFGEITSAKVMYDAAQKTRGFGFVCFSTPEEATRAVTEMNGKMVENKPLYVALAQRKDVRRAQLEAQHAARVNRGGMPQPNMGYPQAPPMFYAPQPGMPQRLVYPQQMGMPRTRWNPQQGGRPPVMHPGMYNNMQNMGPNGRPNPRGRGQRQQQGGRGRNQNNQAFKYNNNVRNRDAAQQPNAQQAQMAQQQQMPPQQPNAQMAPAPLTIQALASAPPAQQKQMIGERLFPLIQAQENELAGKITGMLLEMDNGELLHLLESPEALNEKIQEALQVLQQHTTAPAAPATDGDSA